MTTQSAIYRRVAAHPDYARLRREADAAHDAMHAAVLAGDGETYLGAQLVMKGACDAITEMYDAAIAALREGEAR